MLKLKINKYFRITALSLGIGAIALLLPVFAQSNSNSENRANAESQSLFQPSIVLDSPRRSGGHIAETLAREAEFSSLISALNLTGITPILEAGEAGSLTIFAPTNTAFQKNSAAYAKLLQTQNKDKLIRVLKYHVVSGQITPEKVESGAVETLEGSEVKIAVTSEGVMIGDRAKGIKPSTEASNGVIVRIDNLLLPPDLEL